MAKEIPIQNLYYLLCYAWDQLAEGALIDLKASDSKSLSELFARVLAHGTQHLVKRGFDRGYLVHSEETARLRGRFNLSASMQRLSWRQGRMVCEFDELDHNILHNRILKTTILDVLDAGGIEKERCQVSELGNGWVTLDGERRPVRFGGIQLNSLPLPSHICHIGATDQGHFIVATILVVAQRVGAEAAVHRGQLQTEVLGGLFAMVGPDRR